MEDVQLFEGQVGGHSSFLHIDARTVAKQLRGHEHEFYQHAPAQLLPFIPEYRGVTDIWLDINDNGQLISKRVKPKASDSQPAPIEHVENTGDIVTRTSHREIECNGRNNETVIKEECEKEAPDSTEHTVSQVEKSQCESCVQHSTFQQDNISMNCVDPVLSPARPAGSVPPPGHAPAPAVPAVTHQQKADPWMALVQDGHSDGGGAGAQNLWYLRCYHKQAHALVEQQGVPGTYKYLMLENLVQPYRKPCILDIKMGDRLYAEHGNKVLNEQRESEKHMFQTLGFRISGAQIYSPVTESFRYMHKTDGEVVNIGSMKELLLAFTETRMDLRTDLVSTLLHKLRSLHAAIFDVTDLLIIGSSLLVIYEGDVKFNNNGTENGVVETCGVNSGVNSDLIHESSTNPERLIAPDCDDFISLKMNNNQVPSSTNQSAATVKIIDFAHVEFYDSKSNGLSNQGYLNGLQRLILEFEEIESKLLNI